MAWDKGLFMRTAEDKARIILSRFESSDTRDGVCFSIGGLYLRPYYKLVSERAYKQLREIRPDLITKDGLKKRDSYNPPKNSACKYRFVIEHVIPIDVTYNVLKKMFESGKLSLSYITRMIKDGRLVCAVITKDEDDQMNKLYRERMPDGWDFNSGDPMARYSAVGIKMHQWG